MAKVIEVNYYNTLVVKSATKEWHIEESRIRGGYNNKYMNYGVKAHIVDTSYKQQTRENALIYSGIYNNKNGINNTNQFPAGKDITRAVDIQNGSIQKLFAEDTNLNIFQEEKVSRALIDKDAIYTAEGAAITASGASVIGQVIAYGGNYGIGKNPESFAYYAGRKYFVDKPKGAVLRLSRDGITEISAYGMTSYFRDKLRSANFIPGMWDIYNKDYVVSIQDTTDSTFNVTLAYDEQVNGWTSFYSYTPQAGGSLDGNFYTFNGCDIWKHYNNSTYNSFYNSTYNSEISIIFNQNPSLSKSFQTINYEGSKNWQAITINAEQDTGVVDSAMDVAVYSNLNQDMIISGFKLYDGKFYANLVNNSPAKAGEVVFGGDVSGIKGYFAKMTIKTSDTNYNELFSVSTNYNINSY